MDIWLVIFEFIGKIIWENLVFFSLSSTKQDQKIEIPPQNAHPFFIDCKLNLIFIEKLLD